jgi:hypothetical protein
VTKDQLEKLRMLVEFHNEDNDELGQAARELFPLLDGLAVEPEPTVAQSVVVTIDETACCIGCGATVADGTPFYSRMVVRDGAHSIEHQHSRCRPEPTTPQFKPGDRVQVGPDECQTFGTVLTVGDERCSVQYDHGPMRQPIFAVLKHIPMCKHDDGDCHEDDPCDDCPKYRRKPERAMQALADQAQALDMGYGPLGKQGGDI